MVSFYTVRKAIYGRLSGDKALGELVKGIYHLYAPEGSEPPYVVFNRQSATEVLAMGKESAFSNQLWLLKAISRGGSAKVAEEIDARCAELLNGAELAVEGGTLLYLRRESSVDLSEVDAGEPIDQLGSVYRVMVE